MNSIDLKVNTHKINVNLRVKDIKQRKKKFTRKKSDIIKKEVSLLMEIGWVKEVDYPTQLSNVILTKKVRGDPRIFVDFTNVNKATTKGCFFLPIIYQLLDATTHLVS